MKEQENYECFAIPAHVWTDQDVIRDQVQLSGWTRRNWVYRDGASLGAEAFPSPGIETL